MLGGKHWKGVYTYTHMRLVGIFVPYDSEGKGFSDLAQNHMVNTLLNLYLELNVERQNSSIYTYIHVHS